MITFAISCLAGLALAIWVSWEDRILTKIVISIIFVIVTAVISLISFLPAVGSFFPYHYIPDKKIELCPFQVQGFSSGEVFLSLDRSRKVYCYLQTDEEGCALKRLSERRNLVIIFEGQEGKGYVEIYNSEFDDKSSLLWGIPDVWVKYEFHIPRGTFAIQ